jgi:tetratricopeptide (TPR) repeat protein
MSVVVPPIVVRDPRFVAGRATVGEAPSVVLFATLLQEAVAKYGESHIETAPAYYEYGNALFRLAQRQHEEQQHPEQQNKEVIDGGGDAQKKRAREAAALAAARRAQRDTAVLSKAAAASADVDIPSSTCETKKESEQALAVDSANSAVAAEAVPHDEDDQLENHVGSQGGEGDDEEDDIQLALEMMETAWSILDYESGLATHLDGNDSSNASDAGHQSSPPKYAQWIDEQLPRVLIGIGDVLSALGRHADSADAYLRALEHRQRELDAALSIALTSLGLLQCRRKVVEINILIAEELLACDHDHSVVTSESSVVLVPAGQAIEYARGYYNKARDELQETVVLLGQMASATATISAEAERRFSEEKENVCFAATLVMGAGEALAELDEQKDTAAATGKEPNPKKSKSTHGTGS